MEDNDVAQTDAPQRTPEYVEDINEFNQSMTNATTTTTGAASIGATLDLPLSADGGSLIINNNNNIDQSQSTTANLKTTKPLTTPQRTDSDDSKQRTPNSATASVKKQLLYYTPTQQSELQVNVLEAEDENTIPDDRPNAKRVREETDRLSCLTTF
jgi:hypothetical protein